MNLSEIINRNKALLIDVREMSFAVEFYIKKLTNKVIKIDLQKSNKQVELNPRGSYIDQINKLTVAFNHACIKLKK